MPGVRQRLGMHDCEQSKDPAGGVGQRMTDEGLDLELAEDFILGIQLLDAFGKWHTVLHSTLPQTVAGTSWYSMLSTMFPWSQKARVWMIAALRGLTSPTKT